LGGDFVSLNKTPVALILTESFQCTGLLVAPTLVLTAAHCIADIASNYTIVIAGNVVQARRVSFSPGYQQTEEVTRENSRRDIGMIELSSEVTWIEPVPVLINDPVRRGETALVIGFGSNEQSGRVETIADLIGKAGTVRIQSVGSGLLESTALSSGTSTCSGDSGGPLLQFSRDRKFAYTVGVVSYGENQVDRNGGCFLGGIGLSGFVDLQSSVSRQYFKSFPTLRYLSGSLLRFFYSAKSFSKTLKRAERSSNVSAIRSTASSLKRSITIARRDADSRRTPLVRRSLSALTRLTKITSVKRAKPQIAAVRTAINQLLDFGPY